MSFVALSHGSVALRWRSVHTRTRTHDTGDGCARTDVLQPQQSRRFRKCQREAAQYTACGCNLLRLFHWYGKWCCGCYFQKHAVHIWRMRHMTHICILESIVRGNECWGRNGGHEGYDCCCNIVAWTPTTKWRASTCKMLHARTHIVPWLSPTQHKQLSILPRCSCTTYSEWVLKHDRAYLQVLGPR